MKVVCGFGCYLEPHFRISTLLPQEGGKVAAQVQEKVSGTATNIARNIKALGISTHLVGFVGDDIRAEWIKGMLKQQNVDFTLFPVLPSTPYSLDIVTPAGYWTLITRYDFVPEWEQFVPKVHRVASEQQPDAFVASGITPRHELFLQETFKACSSAVKVLQPTRELLSHSDPQQRDRILRFANILIMNEDEAVLLLEHPFSEGDLIALKRHPQQEVIITKGKEGCSVITESGQVYSQPPLEAPAEEKDPINCGDAFLSAYLAQRLQGEEYQVALIWGAAAGAVAATKYGSDPPTLEEIQKALHNIT